MALLSTQYRYCRVLVLCHWLCRDVVSAPVPSHDTQSHSDQHCSFSLWSSMSCCLSHRHWLVGWDLSNKASGWTGCHHDPGGWSALEPCGLRTEPPLGLKPEGSALQHWEAKKKKRKKKSLLCHSTSRSTSIYCFEMWIVGTNDGICAHNKPQQHSFTAMVCPPGSGGWMWKQLRGLFLCQRAEKPHVPPSGVPQEVTSSPFQTASRSCWLVAAARSFSSRYLRPHLITDCQFTSLQIFVVWVSIVCVKDGCLSFFKSIVSTVRLQK